MVADRARVRITVTAIGVALAVAGCGSSGSSSRSAGATTTVASVSGKKVDANALRVGDCFDVPAGANADVTNGTASTLPPISKLTLRECTDAHDAEVSALGQASAAGPAYPGKDPLSAETTQMCQTTFQAYDGVAFDATSLTVFTFYPSSDTWTQGDRVEICAITPKDTSKLTASVKGSNK